MHTMHMKLSGGWVAARDTAWRSTRAARSLLSQMMIAYYRLTHIDRAAEVFREDPELGFMGGRIELFDPDDAPEPSTCGIRGRDSAKAYRPAGMLQGARHGDQT